MGRKVRGKPPAKRLGLGVVGAILLLMPAAAAAVTLNCTLGMNQYYPDNNTAFQDVFLDTDTGTVVDGNGTLKSSLKVNPLRYQFTYTIAKQYYSYVVSRDTGEMNLIHRWPSADRPSNINGGAHYLCKISTGKPKF